MKKIFAITIGSLLISAMFYNVSQAFPVAPPGTEGLKVLVGGTNDVIATYQGFSAAFSDNLYLMLDGSGNVANDGILTNDLFIFNNQHSVVGSTVNLGSFAVGTELMFRLNNGNQDFFTGAASRNPDQRTHARVQQNWLPNTTLVSFEDSVIPANIDYNDLSFSFTNTQTTPPTPPTNGVPEPAPLALLGLGLLGLGLARRKKIA